METLASKPWRWAALGAAVLALELIGSGTLTGEFRRGLDGPYKPILIGAVAITGAHLMGWLPEQIDPYHQLNQLIKVET